MSKMAELNDEGVTDLVSYSIGIQHGTDMAIKVLEEITPPLTEFSNEEVVFWRKALSYAISAIRGDVK